ncbi:MAG TPA: hypothetical protein DF292_08320 [Firmicutes bacterium]|jgi:hypothetical protein|nr:hypothetical protein [Bacillota bacterium]
MKRVFIGGIVVFTGIITSLSMIIAAAIYAPHITAWSGSKLWFAIFGARQYGNEVVQSLFLGTPFVIGLVLAAIGLVILAKEYYTKQ